MAAPSPEPTEELRDSPEELARTARHLARLIRGSAHFVVFTGAGISTACGIPDLRSGHETCLKTFGGSQAMRETCRARPDAAHAESPQRAVPSFTHMALAKLQEAGLLKHVVSLNTDGLHRRSGIPKAHLTELHGNSNLERCSQCRFEGFRDFRVRNDAYVKANAPSFGVKPLHFHATGRHCAHCGGMLRDTIVNLEEELPEEDFTSALQHAALADVFLVLGSSLTDPHSSLVPKLAKRRSELKPCGGRLAMCNLQRTPLDSKTDLRAHALCDDLMRLLVQELEVVPSAFQVRWRLHLKTSEPDKRGSRTWVVQCLDAGSDLPCHFVKAATFESYGVSAIQASRALHGGEKFGEWRGEQPPSDSHQKPGFRPMRLHLSFFSHYGEPELAIDVPQRFGHYADEEHMLLKFNPSASGTHKAWHVERLGERPESDKISRPVEFGVT